MELIGPYAYSKSVFKKPSLRIDEIPAIIKFMENLGDVKIENKNDCFKILANDGKVADKIAEQTAQKFHEKLRIYP